MAERPIPFSAPMVRAMLAGTKSQTRRVVKPQPYIDDQGNACWNGLNFGQDSRGPHIQALASPLPSSKTGRVRCPYGQPGDRLWVREAFRFPQSLDHLSPSEIGEKALAVGYPKPWCPTQFEADGLRRTPQEWRDFVTPPQANEAGRLRAGMHMPRWASRITLEVTGVRVERLQDISESDALAEGVTPLPGGDMWTAGGVYDGPLHAARPQWAYRRLWEQINGPESWEANPWVWVVEFKRVEVPA